MVIVDVESDGLLEDATKIHCMAWTTPTGVVSTSEYSEMVRVLTSAKTLVGHNIILYDIPLLERILGIKIKAQLIDTLALSWTLFPDRLIHGLESYGEEYGVPKPEINDWHNLSSEEYQHRCREDVKINKRLWADIKNKLMLLYEDKDKAMRYVRYLSFKMDCAREQHKSKWKLDVGKAKQHFDELSIAQQDKLEQLKSVMPRVPKTIKKSRPKKPFKKDGSLSSIGANWFALLKEQGLDKDYDGEVEIISRYDDPNPNSVPQVKSWLFSLGWKPEEFKYEKDEFGNERAIPQIRVEDKDRNKVLCPSVLELIEDNPSVEILEGLSIIQHRLSIFKGFLENERDGWLIADIGGFTNTLRFKHRVLVNLPGVDKPWGKEIRGCLIAPEGYVLCGSDMTSLEDMCKRHYIYPHDPDYVEEMSREGFDPHLDLAKFAGFVTQEEIDQYNFQVPEVVKKLKPIRKNFKVTNYSATYGVFPKKLSRTAKISFFEAEKLLESFWKRNWAITAVANETFVKRIGKEMWLFNPVSRFYYSLRFEKDIFSTLNQGTGVYCFDTWIKEFRKIRSQLTGQFHDEVILTIKEGSEEKCEKLLKQSIQRVNDILKLNVKLDVDIQFGKTYANIH